MESSPAISTKQQEVASSGDVPECSIDIPKCSIPVRSSPVPEVRPCPEMSVDVRQCPPAPPTHQSSKTNPIQIPASLTLAQRAAARHLVAGMKTDLVAENLRLNSRTLRRWKHLPEFIAEMNRLQTLMESSLTTHARQVPRANVLRLIERLRKVIDSKPPQSAPPPPQRETFAQAVNRLAREGFSVYKNQDEYRRRMRELGFNA